MTAFSDAVKPRIEPPLDPAFRPLALANRAYRAETNSRSAPLVVAVERSGGSVSRYETAVSESPGDTERTTEYVERLVKMMLWQRGGFRVTVGGPGDIGEHIAGVYSASGARAFDADFMGGVYEWPFDVVVTTADKVPEARESGSSIGRHLDGCRIGFDLGASDRKVAAVMDGTAVYSEEVAWEPGKQSDPQYHYAEITSALKAAAAHMPRVDAVGGSSAGVFVNNRVMVASLFRAVPQDVFRTQVRDLFVRMKQEWGVPFEVANDGDVTALAGAMSLNDGAVLGVAMGSSEAAGFVTDEGSITGWLNELAFAPVDVSPEAPLDEWSGDRGVGALYFSQQAVFRLAERAGIAIDAGLPLAARLKSVQDLLESGDERARLIWETIGVYLGYGIAHYGDFYDLRHVLVLGRVTSGSGGGIIVDRAREVLAAEFPELSHLALHLPEDEAGRRVGQAVAAASLPNIP